MRKVMITGMSCSHCAAAAKEALEELGLQDVSVDLEGGFAVFQPAEISPEKIAAAIDDAGFEAGAMK